MDYGLSAGPKIDLHAVLARLGLSQYEERLREDGFEDWVSVTTITESDMAELCFKLGDRRKLQRAIRDSSSLSSEGVSAIGKLPKVSLESSPQVIRKTRPYRRHPRPDPNAPPRPKTAYVLFGEHVREDPALGGSSFTEIAKETGKRWKELSDEERATSWTTPAADTLQIYKKELKSYKQTEDYPNYQAYLEEFRQQHQSPEPVTPSYHKAPSISDTVHCNQLPASQDLEDSEAFRQESIDIEDSDLEGQSQDTTSPVKVGMEEVGHISKALGINAHLIRVDAFPLEHITIKAVESFLQGTGSLLYLWDRNEALDLVRSVYHPQKGTMPVYATEVFAMAAVGSCCDGESNTMMFQERFLHLFVYMLSSPSLMGELRYMRLFACLAMCRFTNDVESARKLMLSSLTIGRQTSESPPFVAESSQDEIRYWWKIFRSIVFLESWFAYNTCHESRVTKEDLNLFHPSPSHAEHEHEVFQERICQLGQLAAYIALDLKTATQPKVAQARVHFNSLNQWHRTLPPPLQLSRLSLADPLTMNWHTKRSLLQLHMLFLGLIVEPYRDCLVELGRYRLGSTSIESEELEGLKTVEEQCVLGARQSARVASLLQTENLIRSHCWVSVYTSFTACTILLFSASQKVLELSGEEIGHDLSYASSHLNVLSLCSFDNAMARKLLTALQILYNEIREVMVSPIYRAMRELNVVIKDVEHVSLSYYDAVEGAEEISKTVLDMTRRLMDVLQESLRF